MPDVSLPSALMACVKLREENGILKTGIWDKAAFIQHKLEHTFHKTAKSLQLCSTLCDPVDGSPSGSPVPGILQARTLEWVAISFSNAWMWKVKVKSLSPDSSRPHGLQPTRLLRPWDFPGKSTGVGGHCLLRSQDYKFRVVIFSSATSATTFLPQMHETRQGRTGEGIVRESGMDMYTLLYLK